MRILDWIDDLMTRPTRRRRELVFASRQGGSALAIIKMTVGKDSVYEVYNSAHPSGEPVITGPFEPALRYVFPDEVTRENSDLVWQKIDAAASFFALGGSQPVMLARQKPEEKHRVDLEGIAIERLGAPRTPIVGQLAMEINRGILRHEGRLPDVER